MVFMSTFISGLFIAFIAGYFCGVSQGKKDTRSEIERVKRNKRDEKTDAEKELASYDEFECSPCDNSKRTRLDREQWERDARVARERLSREIEKLETEIVWMGNLLSEISK
jgi:hypothetical protein